MDISIYEQPPDSGTIEERWFDAVGDCTWVRFALDDGSEWAGVFGSGYNPPARKAVLFDDARTALVIAGGLGYVVDAVSGELLHKTEADGLRDAITIPGRDFVIACDPLRLFCVSTLGVTWQSERIALDGIRLHSATNEEVSGEIADVDGWHAFKLYFDDWRFEGAIYR